MKVKEMVDEKYKHLLGKEIMYLGGDFRCKAIPIAIHSEIGITIVRKLDTTEKLVCLNKDSYSKVLSATVSFEEAFENIIQQIESGKYSMAKSRKFRAGRNGEGNKGVTVLSSCAFEGI